MCPRFLDYHDSALIVDCRKYAILVALDIKYGFVAS